MVTQSPAPNTFADIDELADSIGSVLGTGEWFEIDQARIAAFADATEDWQWIHVDPERAAGGPYGGTVAHGYLTLSLLPRLGGQIFRVEGTRLTINYGLEKVRFPQPVRAGDRIRARAELVSVSRAATQSQAVVRYTVEIEGQAKPACVAP